MLSKLIKLANKLDTQGFYLEADLIDEILKIAIRNCPYYGPNAPRNYRNRQNRVSPEIQTDTISTQSMGFRQRSWRPGANFKWRVRPRPNGCIETMTEFVQDITDDIYKLDGKVVEVTGQDNVVTMLYEMPSPETASDFVAEHSSEFTINSLRMGDITITISQVDGSPKEIAIDFEATAVKPNQMPESLYDTIKEIVSGLQ